jgi:ABC-type nitrate/sulfonate/bicarbonate transport system permease component
MMEKALYPIVIASQTVPIIVIAPMLLVWIGYGLAPKIIVVALISFFPVVVNTVDGMKSVDPDLLRLMKTMGASKLSFYLKIQLPTSMPYLFSGLRVAIAVSVIGAVIGEWVGSSQGLGYLMIRSKPQFQTELVFASIAILSTMGVVLFASIVILERLALPWHRGQKQ